MNNIKRYSILSNTQLTRSIVFANGFSLVELMVVIAIIGILSAIAVPSYKSYVIRSKFTELFSLAAPYQVETVSVQYI